MLFMIFNSDDFCRHIIGNFSPSTAHTTNFVLFLFKMNVCLGLNLERQYEVPYGS